MSNADKSKMENATIWVVQPKSHKVGELFHRYPFSAKEKKYATSGSWTFVHSSVVICLQFDVFDFGSDVL